MILVAGVVHGAPEHIEDAPIDRRAAVETKLFIEAFRICATKVVHLPDAEVAQIPGYAGTYTGDLLQIGTT